MWNNKKKIQYKHISVIPKIQSKQIRYSLQIKPAYVGSSGIQIDTGVIQKKILEFNNLICQCAECG